jgi:hypothetical protein
MAVLRPPCLIDSAPLLFLEKINITFTITTHRHTHSHFIGYYAFFHTRTSSSQNNMVRIEELSTTTRSSSAAQDHAWNLSATDRLGRLEIVDQYEEASAAAAAAGAGPTSSFLDPREAERLVDGLETFGLEDVGSSR